MPIKVLSAEEADPAILCSRTIAVLGYGSQGQAHARNLRDAGCRVLVAQRPAGGNFELAVRHGFQPLAIADAVRQASLLILSLPDERMGDIYREEIAPGLRPGQALGFVHGFAIRFGLIKPPECVDVIMTAPKGPGSLVRERFEHGSGVTCLVAVHQDATGTAHRLALAWAAAIGGAKGGMIETTFATECESDLFGEQTVLCGGVFELMKTAFELLVEAGVPEEIAYFECVHEVKQVVDLQYAAGLQGMRQAISNTAAYGGLTRGPRLVTAETRGEMRRILDEIRSGRFAKEWVEEHRRGCQVLGKLIEAEAGHPCEYAGRRVRALAVGGATARGEPAGESTIG